MPIEKVGRPPKEKFRCRTTEERKIIESAKEAYRDLGHNVYEFVRDFFGIRSSDPTDYTLAVVNGATAISIDRWNKLKEYTSNIIK